MTSNRTAGPPKKESVLNVRRHRAKYILADLLSAALAWTLFYLFRKLYIERMAYGYAIPLSFTFRYYLGLVLIPLFWLVLYSIKGAYKHIYEKSRLKELMKTLETTIIGVVILFFALILDDTIYNYKSYYISISVLALSHFILTFIPRLVITSLTARAIRQGRIYFRTLIIGSGEKALKMLGEVQRSKKSSGNKFIGYVKVDPMRNDYLQEKLPCLGDLGQLNMICREYQIEDAIVATDPRNNDDIPRIINKLAETHVAIKVIPTLYDLITGTANITNLYGIPLMRISHDLMPAWEMHLKRFLDISLSLLALLLLSPVYIFLAIGVKLSSPGPVFYSHERIGRYGKPFTIVKFRSMVQDAEKHGPALSSENDPRITNFGLFMRKSRLDELPQFFNVLKGEMSLVGPRPERQYFVDRIVEKAPYYYHLQKVRPGITSWGQVKYGYAENVDEMIERLKYDIIYIENMSLYTDFKIMIYTIKTILGAKGK